MRAPTLWLVALLLGSLLAGVARADVDGDGIADGVDNCPYAANVGQDDVGGPLAAGPDGIGDVCQCGDVDGDGIPNVRDASLYRRALALLPPGLAAVEKCDVAQPAGACDAADAARLREAIAGRVPGIEPLCTPALPPPGVCGNGQIEAPEACDGAELGGATCQSLGYLSGTLGCTAGCAFDTSSCTPYGGPGDACTDPGQCDGGLPCVDGVCCTSSCTGTCASCDLPGFEGVCAPIPPDEDPDSECGALSCAGYYAGWSGDECRGAAGISAADATCNGGGACVTAAQLCPAQASGVTTLVCDANCENPAPGTCTGTTPGACNDVSPGTQTCGVGQCLRIVDQCLNGSPNSCVPGTPTTEVCNNLDENCDGTVDNGAFADSLEPNGDCASARILATAASDQTRNYSTMTIYPSGDWDFYAIPMTETDGSCGCGIFSFDEDYQASVTVTPPVGSGSFEVCMNTNTCGWPAGYCFETPAGTPLVLSQYLDGACPGQDNYTVYLRIRGDNPPGFECLPYTLSYTFDSGLCR